MATEPNENWTKNPVIAGLQVCVRKTQAVQVWTNLTQTTKRPSFLSLTYLQTLLSSWLWQVYVIIFDPDPHSETGSDVTYSTTIKQASAWLCFYSVCKHQSLHREIISNESSEDKQGGMEAVQL